MLTDIRKVLAISLAALLIAACGSGGSLSEDGTGNGDGSGDGSGDGGTGGDGGSATQSFRAGRLTSSGFTSGVLDIGVTTLAASGQTAVAVDIVDSSGVRALGTEATVLFFSDCVTAGKSQFLADSVTTSSGRANTTYVAQGCSGSDKITAQVAVGTQTLSAEGTVTVASAQAGDIQFVSATRNLIGMTGSNVTQQSTLVFEALATGGGPVPDQDVFFSLTGEVPDGVTFTPASAKSDSNGQVRVTIKGGSEAGTVTLRATVGSGASAPSVSHSIVVSTGYPDSDSLSLSSDKKSVDGTCDGEKVTVNVRMADRYNNPVAAETPAKFTTSGGKIETACQTKDPFTPLTEGGVCSVLLNVQEPRPADGLAQVGVEVDGEEAFVDTNRNGFFDAGEIFTDVNSNTRFDGYVCSSPGVGCVTTLIKLTQTMPIVFSDNTPNVAQMFIDGIDQTAEVGTLDLAVTKKEVVEVGLLVTDSRGNSLPSGTTYKLSPTIGSVIDPATVGPFSSIDGDVAAFQYQAPVGTDPDTGVANLTVSIPASGCHGALTIVQKLFDITYTP